MVPHSQHTPGEVLIPEIAPGTAVILDNLATHRNKEAAAALKTHGCWFLYLPPYSPDLNPIEQAFSSLKAHLRRIGARSFTSVFDAIGEVCYLYDPTECWNYFKAAGYVSGQFRNAIATFLLEAWPLATQDAAAQFGPSPVAV